MPDKTYKFVSVCEREKPIQTNNRRSFIYHVASCSTCRIKLPKSVEEELQPELTQLISRHIRSEIETNTQKKAQFDTLIKESFSFQRLSDQFDGFKEQIEQIEEIIAKKIEAELKPRARLFGKLRPSSALKETLPITPEPLHQHPSPFNLSEEIPAAMREDYRAGDIPSSRDTPPSSEESSAIKGLPALDNLEQVETMEHYVADQRDKLEDREKPKLGLYLKLVEGRIALAYERQIERITKIHDVDKEHLYKLLMASLSKKE